MAGIKSRQRSSSLPATLVTVNVAVYVLLFAAWCYDHDGTAGSPPGGPTVDMLMDALALPSATGAWLHRPWTMLTYMFTQYSWWHLAGNMIVLYLFSIILDRTAGRRKVLTVYFVGGVAGAALYLVLGALGSGHGLLVGSSASVMALMGATAVMQPDMRFPIPPFGQPKVAWVVAVLVFFDMLGITAGNAAGHLSHLAGLAAGCGYVIFMRKRRPEARADVELNAVLEKVKRSGFASLNESERCTLFSDYKNVK